MTAIEQDFISTRDRAFYARPGRPALLGAGVVAAFAAAMTMWGTLAPISGAAIASGNLQVEGRRQSVQHPYGGVVRQLPVRDGAHVEKGQLLIALDDSDPRAKLEVLVADRDAALAAEARLIAAEQSDDIGTALLGEELLSLWRALPAASGPEQT